VTVAANDSIGTLSARMMGTDRKLELFRLINALGPTSTVSQGMRVKIISE
jgi:predicted Zn-dependent protease